jgi:hypothetical protein
MESGHDGGVGVPDVMQPAGRQEQIGVQPEGVRQRTGPDGHSLGVPPPIARPAQQVVRQLFGAGYETGVRLPHQVMLGSQHERQVAAGWPSAG